MAPLSKVDSGHGVKEANIVGGHASARSRLPGPLFYAGSLDNFTQQDLTPVIGREFGGLQVTDLLRWGDDMIRDLAITSTTPSAFSYTQTDLLSVSQRGVVFLRDQTVTRTEMKDLMLRITEVSGSVSRVF
jgi:hypothetical protein